MNNQQLHLTNLCIRARNEKIVDQYLNKYPPCFGELETVFPKGKNGLRNTPETCFACRYKTECLKSALEGTGGLKVREEMIDRAYRSGHINFLERWSKKKALQRNRIDKKKKQNKTQGEEKS